MSPIVLITGCSTGGAGHALCRQFALRDCKVYATARDVDKITDFEGCPNIVRLKLDVTSDDDVEHAVQHILEIEGKIDIVVNNAGMICAGPLIDQTLDVVRHNFDTNVFSMFRVAKAVIPAMAKRRQGLIINVGSVVGEIPTPWNGVYCASKAAVHSMTEVLQMECKPFNISVLLVSLGSVRSNIAINQMSRFALPADSLYASFLPNITRRILVSQESKPMPTDAFAKEVVSNALRKNPPSYITLGGHALLYRFLKWLPRSWVLGLMWRIWSKDVVSN